MTAPNTSADLNDPQRKCSNPACPVIQCPECKSAEIKPGNDGTWPECEDCGYVFYDAETSALIAEVKREQAVAKNSLGHVPSYTEAVEKGFCKP